jgi:MFS family permease
MRRTGATLLFAVAGFGAATIVFGLSKSFLLSLAMLFVLGALDGISMIIRSTLVQLRTPDEMRGRVSAVNSVFIDMSNELGGFESGAIAALVGPVTAVVAGGVGTLVVVGSVALAWPQLRQLGPIAPEGEEATTKSA